MITAALSQTTSGPPSTVSASATSARPAGVRCCGLVPCAALMFTNTRPSGGDGEQEHGEYERAHTDGSF